MNPLLLGMLKKAPEIITIARQLADGVRSGKRAAEMADRVAALERNEAQQADLIKEIARQLDDMTALLKVLSRRIAVCLTASVVALGLAITALLLGSGP